MRTMIKKFLDFTDAYLGNTKKIDRLPTVLRKYMNGQKMILYLIPALYLFSIPLLGFNLSLLGAVMIFELIALFNFLDKCNTLIKGEYKVVDGTVSEIEEPNWVPNPLQGVSKKATKKNKRLLLQLPNGIYARVFIGRHIENSFTPGMSVRIYTPKRQVENDGIMIIKEYYTITSIPADNIGKCSISENIVNEPDNTANPENDFDDIANSYIRKSQER